MPHISGEDRITITDDGGGESMQTNDAIEEGAGTEATEYGLLRAMMCTYLENLSTTTRMMDFPWTLGSPLMKFIKIFAHIGTGPPPVEEDPLAIASAFCCAGRWRKS